MNTEISQYASESTASSSDTELCQAFENLSIQSDINQSTTAETSQYAPESTASSSSSESSDHTSSADFQLRRKALNEFLLASGKEAIGQSKKPFSQLSRRTKGVHVSKAKDATVAVLEVSAPRDPSKLWEAVRTSNLVEKEFGAADTGDHMFLEALAEAYENAISWDTRRQILSIMADLVPYTKIQEYIPGITDYRIKAARHHKLKYGRGAQLPVTRSPRMRVNTAQLDHFLGFITSQQVIQDLPFGQRYLHLSSGKVLETPNVIKCMIPQRIINQYKQFCSEVNFQPFSDSTMERILSSCGATVRKSLQGLDYFAAEGAKAFDDLESVVDNLCNFGLERQTGNQLSKSLKAGKQYLKDDYKV